MRGVVVPLFLAIALTTQGCGYVRTMVFPSPSKRSALEIWQTRIDNSWHMRVERSTNQRRFRVYESPNEAFVYFVHVCWSPDEAKVGVIATGTGLWEMAFDPRTGKPVSFNEIEGEMSRSIAEAYHLHGRDPIAWASSTEAHAEFFKLHPEIHLTYGP